MLRVQTDIQWAEQHNLKDYYESLTDDKARFENLAFNLFGEQSERMSAFDMAISSQGVSTSDCLDIRGSGVLRLLDAHTKKQ